MIRGEVEDQRVQLGLESSRGRRTGVADVDRVFKTPTRGSLVTEAVAFAFRALSGLIQPMGRQGSISGGGG